VTANTNSLLDRQSPKKDVGQFSLNCNCSPALCLQGLTRFLSRICECLQAA
jgi:hypothetical protein